jgi:poly[(R)-3-hydroxyalkanoate] polymerase subunit PhaC
VDLIPKPDQVVSAAGNLAHRVVYGGLADLRTMPRTPIAEGNLREVYHYQPADDVREVGDPVLLVTPLAAPALCYDLRRGCSLVEHLVEAGRPTYLVEYGEVSFRDRGLGIERWIDEVVPTAVREVSAHAGQRPVHLVGWSIGGAFALLAAAADASLPVASIAVLGTPFDVHQVPIVAPPRPLLDLSEALGEALGAVTKLYQAAGGGQQPLVQWAFHLSSVQKLVTKPLAIACNLDDADFLAQVEAVDRFAAGMTAYPGRSYGQLYHRLLKGSPLAEGSFDLDGRTVSVADVEVPVLVFAGATDGIAPMASVKALVPLLTGSRDVRFEIVPGGHLGMLTGRAARTSTWVVLGEWIDEWSPQQPSEPAATTRRTSGRATKTPAKTPAKAPARTPGRKTAATTKSAVKKTAAKKTAAKRTSATKTAASATAQRPGTASDGSRDTIGTNPSRRYGSAGSRALGR